jgi:hypothetical protein
MVKKMVADGVVKVQLPEVTAQLQNK